MKMIMFDTHSFERDYFCKANEEFGHEITFYEGRLSEKSAPLAAGHDCVCAFVNDCLNGDVLRSLKKSGVKLIALRSAGFNHVDLEVAKELGLKVVRVPEYSPYSVAEHSMALLLTLNRKIHKAYNRVREGNFSLNGLVGFDLHGKTIGVIGTGKIGKVFCHIALGFGCKVLAFDLSQDEELKTNKNFQYTSLDEVFKTSDVISLHVPLNPQTRHIINQDSLKKMKDGVILINTSRGALVDTKALIAELKSNKLGGAGLDVYEEEANFFFQDFSDQVLSDDQLIRLMTFPNVILTSHQGFLTKEAIGNIAETTLANIADFENNRALKNEVIP